MKIGIVYFSGTGTTAAIAAEIARGFRDSISPPLEVYLTRFDRCDKSCLATCDILGFGAPTYSYRVVRQFSHFLTSLTTSPELISAPKPYFLFLTCGGQPGNTFWDMYHILSKKGWPLLAKFRVNAANNIRAWRPKTTKPPPADGFSAEDAALAVDFAQQVLDAYSKIIEQQTIPPLKIRGSLFFWVWGLLLSWPFEMRKVEGTKYLIETECTQCRLCAEKICTSGAISMGPTGYPVIENSKCIGCSGCVNLCPSLAIASNKTKAKHPFTRYQRFILNPPK
jgi:ferredoxin/flavodoxin